MSGGDLSGNSVEESRDRKGRILGLPTTQRKNPEVLSALFWSYMSIFRVHKLRMKLIAQGPHLDPVGVLMGICMMEINTIACP